MSVSPYEIAIKLTMQNAVSGVFAVIAKDALRLEGGVVRLTKLFGGLNTTTVAAGGALAALGGTAVIGALYKVASYGDKLLDQQDKLVRGGIAYNDVLKLQADYYNKIAKSVPTSTAAEYLKTVNELRAVTGSTAEAAKLAPKAMMIDVLLGNTAGTSKSGEYYKLLRSSEMKGISTDEAKRDAFAEEAYKYIAAFGTKLTAGDFQTLARRGGTAWMNAKPEALGPISVLAADLGASGAGTTLMTMQQLQMGATTLSKQQGEVLEQLGLLDMNKVTRTGFGGGRLQVGTGGMKGSLEHMGNLPGWIKDVVYPAIEKAAGGDEAQIQALISKLSPNRNASKLIEMFGAPKFLDQQFKDIGLAGMQYPTEQAYARYTTLNPKGVKQGVADQFDSMMQAIGAPIMQAALPVMRGVADLFTNIAAFANAHPEGVKLAAEAMAAIGAAMIVLGGAAVVGAAAYMIPGGAVVVALAGIGTAITTLAALNWDAVVPWLELFGKGMSTLAGIGWDALVAGIKGIGSALEWLKEKIGGFFSGLFSKTSFEGGGFGEGGMFHNASYGGGGASGGSRGWSSSYGGGSTPVGTGSGSDVKRVVDAAAMANGVNPRVLYGIIAGESGHGNRYDVNGKGESSWSMFQLNRAGGLGNTFEHETGLSVTDPHNIPAIANWTAKHIAKTHNLSPWRGFHGERDWNPNWGSMGYSPKRAGNGARPVPPHPKPATHVHIESVMTLDGEVLHRSVTRRMVNASTHPTTGPYFDGSRAWSPPDMGIIGI